MSRATDELIDQTLAVVRDVETPAGMRRRIIANVENQVQKRQQSTVISSLLTWKGIWPGIAAIACSFLFVAYNTTHTNLLKTKVHKDSTIAKSNAIAILHWTDSQKLRFANEAKPAHLKLVSRATVEALSATGQDDMHAPSRPAPDMPLTRQEKILIQAVNQNDPVLLAQLQPSKQTALTTPRTDVQQFFKQLVAPMTSAETTEQNISKASVTTELELQDSPQQTQPLSEINNGDSQ